ncbi:hypothetical protein CDD83_5638 [Cordyceps sp. RAO-2017]|nr:hypothetical protein CDD83_5638 [Cordyceps sp. RAO-2017]
MDEPYCPEAGLESCPSLDSEERYDVVIVGAGPAGLMLAACLARWGYRIKQVDNRPEPTRAGRADGIQPRYMDMLRSLGLKPAIMSHSPGRIYETAFWSPGAAGHGIVRTGTSASCPASIGARYPFVTCLHQGLIERVFIADLERRGVEVRRPWTVRGFQTGQGTEYPLLVDLARVDGTSSERVRAKYLFSGEGAKSVIRRQLGIPLLHKDPVAFVWAVMDGLMMCTVHSESGSALIIPREEGLVRLYVLIASSEDPDWDRKRSATEDEVKALAGDIFRPYWIQWRRVDWFSIYPIQQAVADRYTLDQRVFLGGDACHTHSPKAGQGMNTAFLDSVNLAWKMHAVEQGFAHRELLGTYELERRSVAEALIDFDRRYATLFSQRPAADADGAAGGSDFTRAFKDSCLFVSGHGVRYPPNRLNWSPAHPARSALFRRPGCGAGPTPGQVFVTADVTRVEDARVVHLEQAVPFNGSFRVLVLAGDPARSSRALRHLADRLSRDGALCGARRGPGGAPSDDDDNPHSLLFTLCTVFTARRADIEIARDVPGALADYRRHVYADDQRGPGVPDGSYPAHGKLGFDADRWGIVVVRPDGHIGCVIRLVEGGGSAEALHQYFSSLSPDGWHS